jgi:hypothetical protein
MDYKEGAKRNGLVAAIVEFEQVRGFPLAEIRCIVLRCGGRIIQVEPEPQRDAAQAPTAPAQKKNVHHRWIIKNATNITVSYFSQ